MGLSQEFRDFAMRGNVVDMAVGVVIGAAFSKIVGSLVSDVIMPPINFISGLTGGGSLSWLVIRLGNDKDSPAINIGVFLDTVINFLIVALAIFAVVKIVNEIRKRYAAAPAPPVNNQERLLAEIRDLLKARSPQ